MAKRKTLKELEIELSSALEARTRALADYQNLERRFEQDKEKMKERLSEQLLRELFPIFDNLYRSTKHMPKLTERPTSEELKAVSTYLSGIAMIEGELEKVLLELGLEKIPTTNTPFDHNLHEAISYEPSSTVVADTVIDEVEAGWQIKGSVIKPAKVRVSQGSS